MSRAFGAGSRLLMLAALAAGAGCAGRGVATPAPAVTCERGDTALVRDVLYFGRNRPDGGTVSDAEWHDFLNQVVTPRFPAGLTIVDATGQWKGQSGAVEQERAEILTIMHAGDAGAKQAIVDVTAEYKRRFRQEAVLRERTSTCARF